MASNHFNRAKSQDGSNPDRKIRVVAKLRGFSDPETRSGTGSSRKVAWVSVNKTLGENSEGVTISFAEQSSSRYLMDYCFEEHEEHEIIYSREVKPLISSAFEGHSSTVIACGARGSGKTHLIQGSAERPGLAVLAIAELLSMAEKSGRSIAVSFYEVDQHEHAFDLLNQGQPQIQVFEDRGRIQFKGLSQIPVKSTAEFQNLYVTACSALKLAPTKGMERARRSHMGLIVHVFSHNESTKTGLVSKMNFVDLAGYEDTRKKSKHGSCIETNKMNKSIYALLNVCHALSTSESRIPYRESKLTRMLQDSLRGTSRILIVACVNPSFCQDTIYMVSLVSRSCQSIHRADNMKKSGTSVRQIPHPHSLIPPKNLSAKKLQDSKSTYEKRTEIPHPHSLIPPKNLSAKKSHDSKSTYEKRTATARKSSTKGRKLFDEASPYVAKSEKAVTLSDTGSTIENSVQHVEEIFMPNIVKTSDPLMDNLLSDAGNHVKSDHRAGKDDSSLNTSSEEELSAVVGKDVSVDNDHQEKPTPANDCSEACHMINKENNSLMANEDGSPSVSSQLRELSNSLKWLYSSTTLCVPEKECSSLQKVSIDIPEPKTPEPTNTNDRWDVMSAKSPWEALSMRSAGMKNSLVQEYLRFLNTANKEELKKLKGIGEKRASFILELREESPEPFKSLDDIKDIGLSAKQIKRMMKMEVGELFN